MILCAKNEFVFGRLFLDNSILLWFFTLLLSLRHLRLIQKCNCVSTDGWVELSNFFFPTSSRILISQIIFKCYHVRRRLHTRPSVPLSRHRILSRFAVRPTKFDSEQQQLQSKQCRKRKTKRYRQNWPNLMQMDRGVKRRKKHQQAYTVFPNTATSQRSVASDLPRAAYLMRVLDNLRHKKWAFMRYW